MLKKLVPRSPRLEVVRRRNSYLALEPHQRMDGNQLRSVTYGNLFACIIFSVVWEFQVPFCFMHVKGV